MLVTSKMLSNLDPPHPLPPLHYPLQVEALLGPKTAADLAPPEKKKKAKV